MSKQQKQSTAKSKVRPSVRPSLKLPPKPPAKLPKIDTRIVRALRDLSRRVKRLEDDIAKARESWDAAFRDEPELAGPGEPAVGDEPAGDTGE